VVVQEDIRVAIAAGGNVVKGSGELDARLAAHAAKLACAAKADLTQIKRADVSFRA
jgi:hypothetical protein